METFTLETKPRREHEANEKIENDIVETNHHRNRNYKLVCSKEGIQISMICGDLPDLSLDSKPISYNDKRIIGLKISVEGIRPLINEGTLISLIFYVSEIKFEPSMSNGSPIDDDEKRIIILGDEEREWSLKRELLTIPAQWLVKKGLITKENMPIYDASASHGRGRLYLLNKEPKHSDNTGFISHMKLADGIYLFKNYSGSNCRRNGEYLMKKFAPNIRFSISGYKDT